MKLNLGSGIKRLKGFLNVDLKGSEFNHDLNKKFPWKDNSISYIKAIAVLEHLDDIDHFMKECFRIMEYDARLEILVPYYNSPTAYEIDHKNFFKAKWYKGYILSNNDYSSIQMINKPKFKLLSVKYNYTKLGKLIKSIFGEKLTIITSYFIGNLIFTIKVVLQK